MLRHSLLVLLACILCRGSVIAQDQTTVDALNYYVDFLTESVHGLTVAQILFVNYNKDLNKYVDIQSYKLNTHITNAELGTSIFNNPDINTRDDNVSAIMLSSISKNHSKVLSTQTAKVFNIFVTDIVNTLNKINDLRFEVESFIGNNDLENKENIYRSYELLEEASRLFEDYAQKHDQFARRLRQEIKYEYRPVDFIFFEIHSASIAMLQDLRREKYTKINAYLDRIEGALGNFSSQNLITSPADKSTAIELASQVRDMTTFVQNNLTAGSIPDSYKLYGKNYYLHNQLLLSYFNSISPGFVSKMNNLLVNYEDIYLKYDDRPIMYKVIYPQKMKEIETIVTKKAVTTKDRLLDLKLKIEEDVTPQEPAQTYVELEFFDPDLLDRDSISVKFNDEWILEDYRLEAEPKKFKIEVDAQVGNKVFVLAKNNGIIAPNTLGLKYRFDGKGRKRYVKKMLVVGQAYELELNYFEEKNKRR